MKGTSQILNVSSRFTVGISTRATKARPVQRKRNVKKGFFFLVRFSFDLKRKMNISLISYG